MENRKKSMIIWSLAIILVAVAIYTTYQYNNNPAPLPTPPVAEQTPAAEEEVVESIDAIDFALEDLNGNKVSLSDYKGKNIFLNFWASWCGPCKYEMPFIEQLQKENKDPDLVILTVSVDSKEADLTKYLAENKFDFQILWDEKGAVSNLYGIRSIPLSLMINKDFKIIAAHEGAMEDYEMLKEFINLVKE